TSTSTDSTTSTSTDSTTSTSTDSTTSTTIDSTSTSTTIDSTSTTDTSTTVDSTTTTTTTDGLVLPGEVKNLSVASEAEGYGFYYSYEKEFNKEQVSGLTLTVTFADDTTEEYDLMNYFDFEMSPAEKFSKNNPTFKYNVALVYRGNDLSDETGRVVLADGDILKDIGGYNVSVEAYIGVRGDINLDGYADAVDATQAQMYYAVLAAGKGGTTENTKLSLSNAALVTGPDSVYDHFAAFLGDVNQNTHVVENNWKASKSARLIDAVDATNIQIYYALASKPENTDGDEVIWAKVLGGEK
ncbi:MAG: hypothetical protein K2I06_02490, partial [Ruminococcus sp.]|nr:hypothetical protein [Ruminococcus sp.]